MFDVNENEVEIDAQYATKGTLNLGPNVEEIPSESELQEIISILAQSLGLNPHQIMITNVTDAIVLFEITSGKRLFFFLLYQKKKNIEIFLILGISHRKIGRNTV